MTVPVGSGAGTGEGFGKDLAVGLAAAGLAEGLAAGLVSSSWSEQGTGGAGMGGAGWKLRMYSKLE